MKFTGGLPETACGFGSTLVATDNLRKQFPELLKACDIQTLIDAPCGDANWISRTNLRGVRYWGFDNNVQNLQTAIAKDWLPGFEPDRCAFERADVRTMLLPVADAIMCRDFFQHLFTVTVLSMLIRIKRNNLKWLLATSFNNLENEEMGPAMFRPLNLQASPFNLGAPEYEIADPPGSGRILGAWRL